MSAVELENFKASKRKTDAESKQKRVDSMLAAELENFKASKQKKEAARYATKREDINAQRRKRQAAKRAASEPVFLTEGRR